MERIEYHNTDPDLPPGPWHDEPSKVQWPDPETGLACMIKRGPMGVWCGYVGIDPTHPLYGKSYDPIESTIDVHGGLTYAAACDGDEENGICHVPGPGEPEPLWWFGFDCGHAFDIAPRLLGIDHALFPDTRVYRDQAFVTDETTKLAAQIEALR
jgi:hypothetical protein